MSGTQMRLNQLFNKDSGRSFIVAFDHGQGLPIPPGYGNPKELLGKIVSGQPDGILVSAGMLEQSSGFFGYRGAPAAIVRADWSVLAPAHKADIGEHYRRLISPERALALGATAICCYLIARPADGTMFADNVATVAQTIHEAHQVGLPVIVESVLWGTRNENQKDLDGLRYVCRLAAEMGADALKTEYVGNVEDQKTLVTEVGDIPILTLGGAAAEPEAVTKAAADAVAAGVRGLIFGRNVWQVPDMPKVMGELSAIVHA